MCYLDGCGQIVPKCLRFAVVCNHCAVYSIPVHPANKMLVRYEHIALIVVATSVSEDEIVSKVARVTAPRNEVIDFA